MLNVKQDLIEPAYQVIDALSLGRFRWKLCASSAVAQASCSLARSHAGFGVSGRFLHSALTRAKLFHERFGLRVHEDLGHSCGLRS